MPFALKTRSRTIELCEAGNIKALFYAKVLLDLLAHGRAVALSPKDDLSYGDIIGEVSAVNLLGHKESH